VIIDVNIKELNWLYRDEYQKYLRPDIEMDRGSFFVFFTCMYGLF
jgi:hypothetical protein